MGSDLVEIPIEIGNLKSLTSLELSGKFKELPGEISQLTRLKYLVLNTKKIDKKKTREILWDLLPNCKITIK